MKIWFKNTDPTVIISIGKSKGEADESFFEHDGSLAHGMDNEFYDISGGNTLVAKSQVDVDAIKATRTQTAQQAKVEHEARLETARGHLANGIPSTQPEQQKAIDLLYKILSDKGLLG